MDFLKNIGIDMDFLKISMTISIWTCLNIFDSYKDFHENVDTNIDKEKRILRSINIDKILDQKGFGMSCITMFE